MVRVPELGSVGCCCGVPGGPEGAVGAEGPGADAGAAWLIKGHPDKFGPAPWLAAFRPAMIVLNMAVIWSIREFMRVI